MRISIADVKYHVNLEQKKTRCDKRLRQLETTEWTSNMHLHMGIT